MTTNATHTECPTCQFCNKPVEWTRKAGYAAFTHVANGKVDCPK